MSQRTLGTIAKSNSHTDYVCQIYTLGDIPYPPEPTDYAFATFVRIRLKSEPASWLVGLIYDTVLLNPNFGRLGPRLSPQPELAVFSPDYLNEKATLVGITIIGTVDERGKVRQGVPPLAAETDALVEQMTEAQVRTFHGWTLSAGFSKSPLQLSYAPLLLKHRSPLASSLLRTVLQQLKTLFSAPDYVAVLDLLLDQLSWQEQVAPLG